MLEIIRKEKSYPSNKSNHVHTGRRLNLQHKDNQIKFCRDNLFNYSAEKLPPVCEALSSVFTFFCSGRKRKFS